VTSAGELRTMGATECLDVFNNATAPGSKVDLWPCNGGANQKWTVESNGTIVGQQSGLCLDVTGASTAAGTLIEGDLLPVRLRRSPSGPQRRVLHRQRRRRNLSQQLGLPALLAG
jgi:Ricin-type beta-trefoil lectin domain